MSTITTDDLSQFVRFLDHNLFCVKSVKTGKKGAQEEYFNMPGRRAVDYINNRNGKRQLWTNLQRFKAKPAKEDGSKKYHSYDDIDRYANVLLDIDAEKELEDYAATEEERQNALDQMPAVQAWLEDHGFSCGLMAETGNGGGFILPIPPTPSEPIFIAKVAAFLKLVKKETGCNIDTTVFDPARVVGIIGTVNAKLETDDRKNQVRKAIGGIPDRSEDENLLEFIQGQEPDPDALKEWERKFGEKSSESIEFIKIEDGDLEHVAEKLRLVREGNPTLDRQLDWTDEVKDRHGGDRSDCEFGIVVALLENGFSDIEIDYVMRNVSKTGKWAEDGDHYRDLTLRKARSKHQDNLADGARSVSIKDLTVPNLNKNGEPTKKRRWSQTKAAKAVMDLFDIITTHNDGKSTTWIYLDGVYVPNHTHLIRQFLASIGGDLFTRSAREETLARIEDLTGQTVVFDEDPYLLGVKNGVINLRTGEFSEHSPDHLITQKIPVRYDPEAKCPRTLKFFLEVVSHPWDAQTLIDIVATAAIKEMFPVFALLLGEGSNGKGAYEKLLKAFVGADLSRNVDFSLMGKNRFALADLLNALVCIATEVTGEHREIDWLKKATGGDGIRAERKFENAKDGYPYCTIILDANKPPRWGDVTWGVKRRFVKIDFPHIYSLKPDAEKGEKLADPDLLAKLTTPEELSGLLNLVVEAAPRIIQDKDIFRRLPPEETFAEYEMQSNNMAAFVQRFCEIIDPKQKAEIEGSLIGWTGFEWADEIYEHYKAFCHALNVGAEDQRKLSGYINGLTGHGYTRKRDDDSNRRPVLMNIRFREDDFNAYLLARNSGRTWPQAGRTLAVPKSLCCPVGRMLPLFCTDLKEYMEEDYGRDERERVEQAVVETYKGENEENVHTTGQPDSIAVLHRSDTGQGTAGLGDITGQEPGQTEPGVYLDTESAPTFSGSDTSISDALEAADRREAEHMEHFKMPEPATVTGPRTSTTTGGDEGRIFGLSMSFYRDLASQSGGLTVPILETETGWEARKAEMALGMLQARGWVRDECGYHPPDEVDR